MSASKQMRIHPSPNSTTVICIQYRYTESRAINQNKCIEFFHQKKKQ